MPSSRRRRNPLQRLFDEALSRTPHSYETNPPRGVAPSTPAAPSAPAQGRLDEQDVAEESALAFGADAADATDATDDADVDEEPFAPEPFVDDDDGLDEAAAITEAYEAESAMAAGAAGDDAVDRTDVSGAGDESRLYDGIAGDEDDDGVPGPIGLGPEPWNVEAEWSLPDLQLVGDDTDGEALDLDYDDDDAAEEDDEEMQRLLRNAAAAGYHLDDDPVTDELLLDEAVSEDEAEPETPADDGWLPTLLEDDK